MLAYVLALVIGLGSLAIYLAAFFFPEVHRKEDFIWSGVGLFYALVLWVCAGRITGGVLLGQVASVALLGWFGWQTLTLRRSLLPPEQQTPIPSQSEVQTQLKNFSSSGPVQGLQQRITGLFGKGKSPEKTPETPVELTGSSPAVTSVASTTPDTEPAHEEVKEADATPDEVTEVPELLPPNPPEPELVAADQNSVAESAEAATPIAAPAPEVELVPPAEAPVAIEAVPIDPENPPKST